MLENVQHDACRDGYNNNLDDYQRYDERLRKSRFACEESGKRKHKSDGFCQYLKAQEGADEVPCCDNAVEPSNEYQWEKYYI